jgi:hypothetical protein
MMVDGWVFRGVRREEEDLCRAGKQARCLDSLQDVAQGSVQDMQGWPVCKGNAGMAKRVVSVVHTP